MPRQSSKRLKKPHKPPLGLLVVDIYYLPRGSPLSVKQPFLKIWNCLLKDCTKKVQNFYLS